MNNAVYVPKTGSASGVEFYTQLSSISLEVRDNGDMLVCTPIPGKLFKLLFFLKEKRINYEMNPSNAA
jgi:hypothetical protein